MSKKGKSRKLKQHKKIAKIINEIVNEEMRFRNALQAIREKHYPKLETGGIIWNNDNSEKIQHEINKPHCLVYDGTKHDPEYLNKMSHLLNSSKTVMNMTDSEFNPHLINVWK